jgi:histidinol-phosphate aminotransferase
VTSHQYERLPDPGEGLRLHLNENTAGCSERVLEAMREVSRLDAAFYPDYTRLHAAVANYFGVDTDHVLVTNGLDEGIHAASFAWLPRGGDGHAREAVIVEPAFDMYAACADAAGGRIVHVMPRDGFEFPAGETLAAITAATRLVFLTSPNNPTGRPVPRDAVAAIMSRLPEGGLVFLDEAYADFAGSNFLGDLARWPQLLIGRTFAKAHGLAAVRAGAVIAAPAVIARLRRVVPPYSVNAFAIAAMLAAVDDREHLAWYCAQVDASRRAIYATCQRLGIHYWPSEANFVLMRIGERSRDVVAAMAARGVFVRDRSGEPGCAGCVRLTAGVVAHTERALAVLEEVVCAER